MGDEEGRRACILPPTQIDSMNHAARDMDAVENFYRQISQLQAAAEIGGHAEMAQVQANGATRR